MKVTILGSGTSTGIPVIGCRCKVCRSRNPKNKRLRASAWFQAGGKSILIDTSVDFRQQALTHKIPRVDAVLYTHPHADHIHGIDELRCYNFLQEGNIPVYGNEWSCRDLQHKFPYVFAGEKPEGGGIPRLTLNRIEGQTPFEAAGIPVTPLPHAHGSQEALGYRIHSVAYVTDCSYIPAESLDRMRGLSVLILDCVRLKPHRTHFNLDQALETVNQVRPRRTYLTHLGHDFDHSAWARKVTQGSFVGVRRLKVQHRSLK